MQEFLGIRMGGIELAAAYLNEAVTMLPASTLSERGMIGRSKTYGHNGKRECERRARQRLAIEAKRAARAQED